MDKLSTIIVCQGTIHDIRGAAAENEFQSVLRSEREFEVVE